MKQNSWKNIRWELVLFYTIIISVSFTLWYYIIKLIKDL